MNFNFENLEVNIYNFEYMFQNKRIIGLLNVLLTLHYIIPFIHHFQFKMNVYKQGKTYTRDTNVYSKDLRFRIETSLKILINATYTSCNKIFIMP